MQTHLSAGFQADSVAYGLVQENIIDMEHPAPIQRFVAESVNNRSAAGRLIRGFNVNAGVYDSELEDIVELAMVLGI